MTMKTNEWGRLAKVQFASRFVVVVLLTLWLSPQAVATNDCALRVGWEPWPPYTYRGSDGQLTGLDVELVRALAFEAECTLTFVEMPWVRMLDELRRGAELDMMLAASYTSERAVFAHFSKPYRDEVMRVFVRAAERHAYPIDSFEHMLERGFILGVTRDYYYGADFAKAMEDRRFARLVQVVTTDLQNLRKLDAVRIDGFIADTLVTADLVRRYGSVGGVVPLDMVVHDNPVHFMFSKVSTSPEVVQRFNVALEVVKASGIYDRILSSYRLPDR